MKTIEIKAFPREHFGKKSTNSLRAEDNVPCVMYMEKENLHFYAHENAFRGLVYTPDVFLVNLEVAGKSYKAVMKEIQFHPVSDRLQHIDFMQVSEDKPVTIDIPLKITGESSGVKAGGKLRVKRRTLKVKGLTKYIPDHMTIDITGLGIGQSVKIGDLNYENLDIIDNKRAMIVAVEVSRVSLKEEEAAAPGAEAPAAEAPAPAKEQPGKGA
ncbi:MAG: 50S ribosomal protein L25/general stress protein Ctc [Bacteroidales bacterium]|jgi:large subunit ribosomal protein L25|nr:50S ribosomal protein L25/general stress protein Ctc [Bacteroidales bacterium]MDX9926273.1 50S ribosomal protein L25/general stress protein Ctc [Bacteroidales bacterium]HNX84042.1 50S ribosomal protein L25/general stress protein Ctc [Bacteroidales bacterium]HPS97961.1 50S ribosomal protein L25/general stress protein Ctc [Bacteroidales bacterium]